MSNSRFLRRSQVKARTRVAHSTLCPGMAIGTLRRPVHTGRRAVEWPEGAAEQRAFGRSTG